MLENRLGRYKYIKYMHAEKKRENTYLRNDERFQRERGVKIFFLECCYTPPGGGVPGPVPPADEQQSISRVCGSKFFMGGPMK